ncbi:hypothetical protein HDV00_000102 [Rhizophlyctis rosea]|nr:hypothetical protein HDV00_000102 [Rhizophlyctis rosea]
MTFRNRWQLVTAKKTQKSSKMYAILDEEEAQAEARAAGERVTDADLASGGKKRKRTMVPEKEIANADKQCNDYVYDFDLERILHAEKAKIDSLISRIKEPNTKKHRANSWVPTLEEVEMVKNGSTLAKCSVTCTKHGEKCMACEMDKLFQSFHGGDHTPFGATSFLFNLWESQKHLSGYQQQDAHEFFIACLNEIHSCCSGSTSHDTSNCHCIVHNTFSGSMQSEISCLQCGGVSPSFDPFLDLSLDVKSSRLGKKATKKKPAPSVATAAEITDNLLVPKPEVNGADEADVKEEHPKNTKATPKVPMNVESTTLLECLEKFTVPEHFSGYTCTSCGPGQAATKQLSLKRLPPVLSFQLKRFEHSTQAQQQKIETIVRVPMELDMTPYTTRSVKHRNMMGKPRRDSAGGPAAAAHPARRLSGKVGADKDSLGEVPSYRYKLFAVVNHMGKMDTGHYTAFAMQRGQWFSFDDAEVKVATEKDVLESNSYMCFYVKDNYELCPMDAFEVRAKQINDFDPLRSDDIDGSEHMDMNGFGGHNGPEMLV